MFVKCQEANACFTCLSCATLCGWLKILTFFNSSTSAGQEHSEYGHMTAFGLINVLSLYALANEFSFITPQPTQQ